MATLERDRASLEAEVLLGQDDPTGLEALLKVGYVARSRPSFVCHGAAA